VVLRSEGERCAFVVNMLRIGVSIPSRGEVGGAEIVTEVNDGDGVALAGLSPEMYH